MKKMMFSLLLFTALSSLTIAEKMGKSTAIEGTQGTVDGLAKEMNENLVSLRLELDDLYQKGPTLEKEEEYYSLLQRVNEIKAQLRTMENRWHDVAVGEAKREEEGYALWDQEETTLASLVMEYGALDFLYIVPPELASMKLNMHSNLPIPRESWSEVLEIILAHNGIGVKKMNPYARQLYILKQDPSSIGAIASSVEQLQWISDQTRIFYVFSPPVEQVKSAFHFFERFADARQTFVYQVGPKLAVVASKVEIQKLIELYNTVWENAQGKVSRVIPVTKMGVKEMEKILQSFFTEAIDKARPPFAKQDQDGLTVFSLGQGNAIVLIGQPDVVSRAEKIVQETEDQLHDPAEMTVYLYQCRNSNPDDLAKVLEKVYASLLLAPTEGMHETEATITTQGPQFKSPADGYPSSPPLVVAPPPLKVGNSASVDVELGNDHFIADPKTGALLMVVRRDALAKIKDLLRKLDVPKKMVQIEVMLFEKRFRNQSSFGINLLKLGSKKNGVRYTSDSAPAGIGVFEFLLHGKSSKHFPAYDLIYSFLMTQEDIQLNAAPSVVTVNQTTATISIVEEISINNGAAPVDTNKGIAFEKSFTRANYGIIINMTPTVNMADEEDPYGEGVDSITLQTNVTFDTTRKHHNDDRPNVDRRHVENEVRVPDGQTVILGGLRRKTAEDEDERIPFLGEIPGIGKFFGSTKLTNHNTEMFIFITPTIVLNPQEQLLEIRTEELKKRPGDIPEFLERVVEARNKERKKFFNQSIEMFFTRSY